MAHVTRKEIIEQLEEIQLASFKTFTKLKEAEKYSNEHIADWVIATFGHCTCSEREPIWEWFYSTECTQCGQKFK